VWVCYLEQLTPSPFLVSMPVSIETGGLPVETLAILAELS